MQIVPMQASHLDDAAATVARRYAELRRTEPLLPVRYEAAAEFLPFLASMAAENPGVSAFEGGRFAGFLIGWRIPSFHGERAIYSPEWANGVEGENTGRTYQALYTALAPAWVADGHVEHYLTLLPHDRSGLEGWQWLGFGYYVTDALRGVQPAAGPLADIEVRSAGPADFPRLAQLEGRLQAYLRGAPTFLALARDDDHGEMKEFLENPANATFMAWREGQPIAYMRFQEASTGACTVIRDTGTTSITGAYTAEGARGGGVARALLNAGLAWARDRGYVRCAVDFESMNTLGAGFWLRHFRPVAVSLHRHINAGVI